MVGVGPAQPGRLLGGEHLPDQRQGGVLLVFEVPGQPAGQRVDQLARQQRADAGVGQGVVDGPHHRCDGGVFDLHDLHEGQVLRPADQPLSQRRPQRLVLRRVVGAKGRLEQLPSGGGGQYVPGVAVHGSGDPVQMGQLPAQGVVHRVHHGQVDGVVHGGGVPMRVCMPSTILRRARPINGIFRAVR